MGIPLNAVLENRILFLTDGLPLYCCCALPLLLLCSPIIVVVLSLYCCCCCSWSLPLLLLLCSPFIVVVVLSLYYCRCAIPLLLLLCFPFILVIVLSLYCCCALPSLLLGYARDWEIPCYREMRFRPVLFLASAQAELDKPTAERANVPWGLGSVYVCMLSWFHLMRSELSWSELSWSELS